MGLETQVVSGMNYNYHYDCHDDNYMDVNVWAQPSDDEDAKQIMSATKYIRNEKMADGSIKTTKTTVKRGDSIDSALGHIFG